MMLAQASSTAKMINWVSSSEKPQSAAICPTTDRTTCSKRGSLWKRSSRIVLSSPKPVPNQKRCRLYYKHMITREFIRAIEPVIRPHIRRTPVIEVEAADFGLSEGTLALKLELLQHTGSFKA